MANINFNQVAQQIFTNLSAQDGVNDNKIGKKSDGTFNNSIWNNFADAAGGNHIKNYIEQGNAIKSITTYLQRAINDVGKLNQIANAGGVSITSDGGEQSVQAQPEAAQSEPPADGGIYATINPTVAAVQNDDSSVANEVISSAPVEVAEQPVVSAQDEAVAVEEEECVEADAIESETLASAPSTGDIVSVLNEDGTSYQINSKEHTITKYSADNQVVEQRAMTPEEQALSPQELITQLQTPAAPAADEVAVVDEVSVADGVDTHPAKPAARQVSGKGISGSYTFIESEDGKYDLKFNMSVEGYKNQAARAYQNRGHSVITMDDKGVYNFRSIKSKNYNILQTMIISESQNIAVQTAVYQDLQAKQENGETLTPGEQKFIQDYNQLLQDNGLQMNSNGELEDIPPQKTRGSRKH